MYKCGRQDDTSTELLKDHEDDAMLGHASERSRNDGGKDADGTCRKNHKQEPDTQGNVVIAIRPFAAPSTSRFRFAFTNAMSKHGQMNPREPGFESTHSTPAWKWQCWLAVSDVSSSLWLCSSSVVGVVVFVSSASTRTWTSSPVEAMQYLQVSAFIVLLHYAMSLQISAMRVAACILRLERLGRSRTDNLVLLSTNHTPSA